MTPKKPTALASHPPNGPAEARPPAGGVDQIRDIIFGPQMADYDRRFQSLDQLIRQSVDTLRKEAQANYQQIESRLRQLESEWKARQSQEAAERKAGLDETRKALAEATKTLSQSASKQHGQMGEQLSQTADTWKANLEALRNELNAALEAGLRKLETNKTDRAALAKMLADVAARIDVDGTGRG